MSAADHFGPQLQMFVPAGALADADVVTHMDAGDSFDWEEMLEGSPKLAKRKVAESKAGSAKNSRHLKAPGEQSLYDAIKEEGVRSPVDVLISSAWGPELANGHHRVFAAADINPAMEIPIRYLPG